MWQWASTSPGTIQPSATVSASETGSVLRRPSTIQRFLCSSWGSTTPRTWRADVTRAASHRPRRSECGQGRAGPLGNGMTVWLGDGLGSTPPPPPPPEDADGDGLGAGAPPLDGEDDVALAEGFGFADVGCFFFAVARCR